MLGVEEFFLNNTAPTFGTAVSTRVNDAHRQVQHRHTSCLAEEMPSNASLRDLIQPLAKTIKSA